MPIAIPAEPSDFEFDPACTALIVIETGEILHSLDPTPVVRL